MASRSNYQKTFTMLDQITIVKPLTIGSCNATMMDNPTVVHSATDGKKKKMAKKKKLLFQRLSKRLARTKRM